MSTQWPNRRPVGASGGRSQIHPCMRSSYPVLLAIPPSPFVVREPKTLGDDDLSGICRVHENVGLGCPMAGERVGGCVCMNVCVWMGLILMGWGGRKTINHVVPATSERLSLCVAFPPSTGRSKITPCRDVHLTRPVFTTTYSAHLHLFYLF